MNSTNGHFLVLNIGVVGAGIAGLAAAAVLSRLGHNVELYERSHFTNEVGAAIHIGPNSAPILRALGFDIAGAKLLEVQQGVQFDGETMKETYRANYDDYRTRYGAPWYFSHRVDLHRELKRLALQKKERSRGASLNSATVTYADCENGILTFADGTAIRKDVIIGADGVHSVVAQSVLGGAMPKIETSHCAYRFMVPTAELLKNSSIAPYFQEKKTTFSIAAGSDRRIVWYPCRNGELMNFVCIHPAKDGRLETEEWNVSGNTEDLIATYSSFHPALLDICSLVKEPKLWKLVYRPPIETWAKGKTILIGDAAHPMLPHQGQGANQGIEDAGALGVFLSRISSLSDIPARLQQVQDARRNRAAAMQIFSNAGQDNSEQIEAEARTYVKGDIPKNQEQFHDWNFGYNVVDDCERISLSTKI
ncbi:hypothetical protein J3E73DRAFT_388494 [Bipolaris maydis]|nr:hypothetical protein J3E73DRAFT_388494 [Bipolaris maydis]